MRTQSAPRTCEAVIRNCDTARPFRPRRPAPGKTGPILCAGQSPSNGTPVRHPFIADVCGSDDVHGCVCARKTAGRMLLSAHSAWVFGRDKALVIDRLSVWVAARPHVISGQCRGQEQAQRRTPLGRGLLILVCASLPAEPTGERERRRSGAATGTFFGPRVRQAKQVEPRAGAASSEAGSNRYQEPTSDFYFHLPGTASRSPGACTAIGDTLHSWRASQYCFSVELRCVLLATKTQYRIGPRRGAGHWNRPV